MTGFMGRSRRGNQFGLILADDKRFFFFSFNLELSMH
jgi:hypothetical protein